MRIKHDAGESGEILLINGTAEDVKGIAHPIEFNYKITGEEKTWPKVMGAVSIFFCFRLPYLDLSMADKPIYFQEKL